MSETGEDLQAYLLEADYIATRMAYARSKNQADAYYAKSLIWFKDMSHEAIDVVAPALTQMYDTALKEKAAAQSVLEADELEDKFIKAYERNPQDFAVSVPAAPRKRSNY